MQIEVHELELRHAALRVSDAASASRMRASLAVDGQRGPVTVIVDGAVSAQPYVLIDGYGFLGQKEMVGALLDRLRHRCHTVRIEGQSLRAPQS
jgi:hypothetical protein